MGPGARVLILGSMPGVASLEAAQYYAHPRNRFWSVIADVLEEPLPSEYAERLALLRRRGIALWDVLGACRREGSLDSAIDPTSLRPNPIPELLAAHPGIALIATNGGFASRTFEKTFPQLRDRRHLRLPSTSPANTSWQWDRLRAAWQPVADSLS